MTNLDEKLNRLIEGELEFNDLPESEVRELRSLNELAQELRYIPKPQANSIGKARAILAMEKEVDKLVEQKTLAISFTRLFSSGYIKMASVVMIALLTFSVSAKSVHSDPDSILYPLKIVGEKVSYVLSINRKGKAELRIKFSDERLKEFEHKYKNRGLVDQKLIDAFLSEAQLAINDIQRVDEKAKESLSERFTRLNSKQLDLLKKVESNVEPQRRPMIRQSINVCEGMRGMRGMMRMHNRNMRRRMMR